MYNRYVPQPDGSFRRCRVAESQKQPLRQPSETGPDNSHGNCDSQPECPPSSPINPPVLADNPRQEASRGQSNWHGPKRSTSRPVPKPCPREPYRECASGGKTTGAVDFLKKLIPKDFDTGDLLIVLLLLLMSGDCAEDQNSALLTLVLYLFL